MRRLNRLTVMEPADGDGSRAAFPARRAVAGDVSLQSCPDPEGGLSVVAQKHAAASHRRIVEILEVRLPRITASQPKLLRVTGTDDLASEKCGKHAEAESCFGRSARSLVTSRQNPWSCWQP